MADTEIIDRLYLELSQFTTATTARERLMESQLEFAAKVVSAARRFMAQPIPVAMPSEYHTLKRLLEEN